MEIYTMYSDTLVKVKIMNLWHLWWISDGSPLLFIVMFLVVISGCVFAIRSSSISINDQCSCLPALPGKRCPISAALYWCSRCWDRENKDRFVHDACYTPPPHRYPEPTTNQEPTHQKKRERKTINQKLHIYHHAATNLFHLQLKLFYFTKYWKIHTSVVSYS